MKKFIFFSLCLLSFLATAFCSPHNGDMRCHQGGERIKTAQMYQDVHSVIPLQAMVMQQLKLVQLPKLFLVKTVNSKLYYRNFFVNGKNKPVIFKEEIRFFPVFYYDI